MKRLIRLASAALLIVIVVLALLIARLESGNRDSEIAWDNRRVGKVVFNAATNSVTIIPLANWNIASDRYRRESGVSLLIGNDAQTILFDVGFDQNADYTAPMAHNLAAREFSLSNVDFVFLSHRHRDHIGGTAGETEGRLIIERGLGLPAHAPVVSPVPLEGESRTVVQAITPQLLGTGIATTGPIARRRQFGHRPRSARRPGLPGIFRRLFRTGHGADAPGGLPGRSDGAADAHRLCQPGVPAAYRI